MHKFNISPPRLWYQKRYLTRTPKEPVPFTNLIRDIKQPQFNQIWSSDLTYIKHKGKFLYLATIQDISTKEIISFNLGSKHDSNLVLKTAIDAVNTVGKSPTIFHSDRGNEFLAQKCVDFFQSNGTQISVSDPGSPWQNGHSESFFSRFKCEFGDFNQFEDIGQLTEYIYNQISYYNNERIVTRLKMSPVEYRKSLRICS